MQSQDKYAALRNEAEQHYLKQASALKWWRWTAIAAMLLGFISLFAHVGPLQIIVSILGCVYWRDVRNREAQLERFVGMMGLLEGQATEIEAIKSHVAPPPEHHETALAAFMKANRHTPPNSRT